MSFNIEPPPLIPLPLPEPNKYPIDWERIIIVGLLVLAVVFITLTYIFNPQITSWDIKCVQPEGALVKNNIQGTHFYDDKISFKENKVCVEADSSGELWGSSMQPTFFEGNTVLLKNYTKDVELKSGYMLRYYRLPCNETSPLNESQMNESEATLHRINAVYDDYILMSGDNLNEDLESIQRCQITSVVVGIIYT